MRAGTRLGPRSLVTLAIVALALLPATAGAAEPARHVDVVQVSGWIDPVVVDFLNQAVAGSEQDGAEALVIQLDSPGALVSTAALEARVRRATVPVAVWIGGAGAKAKGGAAAVALAAPLRGMAPGARLQVGGRLFGPDAAVRAGAVQLDKEQSGVIGTFLASLDGREASGRTLHTATFTPSPKGPPAAALTVQARLAKLDLGPRIMHTVASPPVAYLLLLAGLALVVFELFTGGVGIAAGVGAAALVLSAYGLAVLPTRPLGLVLLALAAFGFGVDVQTGAPRFWTGAGVVALVAGSLVLFDEPVRLGWLPLAGGVVGFVLMMLAGLPATVRSRFSTPTIGRESMIGDSGEAVAALDPEGVVRVRDALWPARTNRATPIAAGDGVTVVGIDGSRLEVIPRSN